MWIMGQIHKTEKQQLIDDGWEVTELDVKQFNKLLDPKNKGKTEPLEDDILVAVFVDNDLMNLFQDFKKGMYNEQILL